MTKEERDEKIYEWADVLADDLITVEGKVRLFKKGINWQEWLLPEEKKKWDSLSDIEQIQIIMCGDPINALNER